MSTCRKNCFLQEAVYQLGVSMDQLMDSLEELVYDKSVIVTEERDVYLPSLYYSEMNCARMLFDLNVPVERPTKALDELISRVEKSQGIVLDDQQKIAVKRSSHQWIFSNYRWTRYR